MMNNLNRNLRISVAAFALACFLGAVSFARAEEESGQGERGPKGQFWMKDRGGENSNRAGVSAEDRETKMKERSEKWQEAFCDRLSEKADRVQSVGSNRFDSADKRKMNRESDLSKSRGERDAELAESRADREKIRQEMYVRLMERAGDDAEKQAAVTTFREAVEKAISDRKKSIDEAIAAFRGGVDAAIGSKKSAVESSISSYQSKVQDAFGAAIASCKAGDDPSSVRSTLEQALRSARESMNVARSTSENIGVQVKKLADAKRTAFLAAHAAFKSALEAARADLKKSFGENSSEEKEGE